MPRRASSSRARLRQNRSSRAIEPAARPAAAPGGEEAAAATRRRRRRITPRRRSRRAPYRFKMGNDGRGWDGRGVADGESTAGRLQQRSLLVCNSRGMSAPEQRRAVHDRVSVAFPPFDPAHDREVTPPRWISYPERNQRQRQQGPARPASCDPRCERLQDEAVTGPDCSRAETHRCRLLVDRDSPAPRMSACSVRKARA